MSLRLQLAAGCVNGSMSGRDPACAMTPSLLAARASGALEADRRTLILDVPDGAEDALAAFVALLGDRS